MNLNKINLMGNREAKTFLEDKKKESKKVFAYFKFYEDHNMNIKKEFILALDPDSINVDDDMYDGFVIGKISKEVKDLVIDSCKKSFYLTKYTIDENSSDDEILNYTEHYFSVYLLSDGQVLDYKKELEKEAEELSNKLSYIEKNF